jgi:hypothetical protein
MNHKGVEYVIAATATPGVWKWQFRIGEQIKIGKTETMINLLAIRRVQLRIDRELKKLQRAAAPKVFEIGHSASTGAISFGNL